MSLDEDRIRVFIAVDLPAPVKQELSRLQGALRESDPNLQSLISWVRPEGMHLTLKFLGEVHESRAKLAARVLDEVVPNHRAFELDLVGLGAFPVPSRCQVLWVGLRSGAERVCGIQHELEDRMLQVGFRREERKFEPHLTLARLKEARRLTQTVAKNSAYAIPGVPVDSVHLIRSILDRGFATYSTLHSVALQPR